MHSLDAFARETLAGLEQRNQRRTLHGTARHDQPWVWRDGQRLLSFCCNDYLNLSTHPAVIDAAIAATRRYGVGAGASRLVTGNHPLYAELETRLARHKGTEAACVFGSGYLANLGIVPVLAGPDDLLLVDELAHASLWAGARLARGRVLRFRHNDLDDARGLLAAERAGHRRALVLTDTVFSMDGDLAPLGPLAALAEEYDAWLLSDDAHGLGVLSAGPVTVPLQMGTLSKAVGAYGGYLCASRPVVDLIQTRARTFIYSTGLPPGTIAAAIAALDVIEAEPDYAARPLQNARAFAARARLPEPASQIVPLILGDEARALEASRVLARAGFFVSAIRPPTVPDGTSRLRFTFTARHEAAEIARLADVVRDQILA